MKSGRHRIYQDLIDRLRIFLETDPSLLVKKLRLALTGAREWLPSWSLLWFDWLEIPIWLYYSGHEIPNIPIKVEWPPALIAVSQRAGKMLNI